MKRGSIQALTGTILNAQKACNLPLWLCGGDANILLKELQKNDMEVNYSPNLVMEGMVNL